VAVLPSHTCLRPYHSTLLNTVLARLNHRCHSFLLQGCHHPDYLLTSADPLIQLVAEGWATLCRAAAATAPAPAAVQGTMDMGPKPSQMSRAQMQVLRVAADIPQAGWSAASTPAVQDGVIFVLRLQLHMNAAFMAS
jgi:hypothetical protein